MYDFSLTHSPPPSLSFSPRLFALEQVHDVLTQLARPFHWIVPGILVGGEKKKAEKARLRKGLSVVVGTPGRLSDHVSTTQCWDLTRSACEPFGPAPRNEMISSSLWCLPIEIV